MQTISISTGSMVVRQQWDWLDGVQNPETGKYLTKTAILLYEMLVYASQRRAYAFPAIEWLAKRLRRTKRTIYNALKELIDAGVIAWGWIMSEQRPRLPGCAFLPHPALLAFIAKTNEKLRFPLTAAIQELDSSKFVVKKISHFVQKIALPPNYREGSVATCTPPMPPGGGPVAEDAAASASGPAPCHPAAESRSLDAGGTTPAESVAAQPVSAKAPEQPITPQIPSPPSASTALQEPAQPGSQSLHPNQVPASANTPDRQPASAPEAAPEPPSLPAQSARWAAVLPLIKAKFDERAARVAHINTLSTAKFDEYALWIEPITAFDTAEGGIKLDCPDRYMMEGIKMKYGSIISDALQGSGVDSFEFCFGMKESLVQRKQEVKAQCERRERDSALRDKYDNMTPHEQFSLLVKMHPKKKPEQEYRAWEEFRQLMKRDDRPSFFELISLNKRMASSQEWTANCGRYIPNLRRWLHSKPWWNCGSTSQS